MKRSLCFVGGSGCTGRACGRRSGSTKINGWISDSMCGAKHAGTGASCVKKCIEGGMSAGVCGRGQEDGLDHRQPGCGEELLWDHVTVTATSDASKKSVHIEAISAAK